MTVHWIDGRRFLTIETVASCYDLEVSWVETVVRLELAGPVQRLDGHLVLAVSALERVASIRRLQLQSGLDLSGVRLLLTR